MGNRLSKTDSATGTEGYTYNAANMLLTRGTNTYTNDLNGNTLTGGGRTNTWDSENRLITCANGTNSSVFSYGSDGLRHRSTTNTTTTDFALDGQNVVREMRAGVNYATYLSGPSGPMYRRSDGDGTIRWYVYDGLGSVVGEVDPNGVMTARRGFDVYGATRSSSGTATSKHGFVGGLGHTTEDETGLVYMRARYYDPIAGRFISQDSSKNGSNWFAYVDNNPVNYGDSSGKAKSLPWALSWWTVGMGFALLSLMAFMENASSWISETIHMQVATSFAVLAVAAFAFAAVGLDGFSFGVSLAILGAVLAIPAAYFVLVGKSLEGAQAVPYVRAAVGAAYIEGLVILGYCASIGADA